MRALVYYVAVTLDGRIAGPDGSFDFFPMDEAYARAMNQEWGDGLPTAFHEATGVTPPGTKWDTVIMGRGTFEPALQAGIASPYAHLTQYVYSTTLDPAQHSGVTVITTDPLVDGVFAPSAWRLIDQKTFDLGVVLLTYERA